MDMEEDVPVHLGQRRGPRPAFAHYAETNPRGLFGKTLLDRLARSAATALPWATRRGAIAGPVN
jgi:hypothetical protein